MPEHILSLSYGFLSALPARGATGEAIEAVSPEDISIRAPREGSDRRLHRRRFCTRYFYPRSPRGERPIQLEPATGVSLFLSALPARGATIVRFACCLLLRISIRAPREGSDKCCRLLILRDVNFYPRSPRGERRYFCFAILPFCISIRAPREGSDASTRHLHKDSGISIRAPREGSDLREIILQRRLIISIRAPREGSDTMRFKICRIIKRFLSALPARGATLEIPVMSAA